jgi:hypothetical protein
MDHRSFRQEEGWQTWMCVDYRAINALTVKWKYPIPTSTCCWINYVVLATTKIDLNQAYHQIRVAEDSKKYTAMLTR